MSPPPPGVTKDGPGSLTWIPDVFSGRVNVTEPSPGLDLCQAIAEGAGFIKLRVDHLAHEKTKAPPMAGMLPVNVNVNVNGSERERVSPHC